MFDDFVSFVVKHLVDQPEEVEVTEEDNQDRLRYVVKVADGELGKVIGKKGRNLNALRTLLVAVAARRGQKVVLDVLDEQ